MNKKMIKYSLLGSASALGTNWIYDRLLMEDFSKTTEGIFLPIQHELYKKAENGFDVYPDHKVGDLDFMGEVIYQFHTYLQDKSKYSLKKFVYEKIGPNSGYKGYIEKYGKVLIEEIDNGIEEISIEDKQLIGAAMYIIGYANDLSDEEILEYSKVFTIYEETKNFHLALKDIFNNISTENKNEVLYESTKFLAKEYKEKCWKALEEIELFEFIDNYSGVACGLEQSFPLIYYIVSKTKTIEEALILNARLSGASSARGIIIGAIYSLIDDMPGNLEESLNYDI